MPGAFRRCTDGVTIMKKAMFLSLFLAVAVLGGVQAAGLAQLLRARGRTEPFEQAAMFVEFNHTDVDAGVHIQTDHDVGLRELCVVSPRGRIVAEMEWSTAPPLGLTELRTESAEPDATSALRAYPPGEYRILGLTIEGDRLLSRVTLSHALLPAPEITSPADGDVVPTSGVIVMWNPVVGAQDYIVEFEEDAPGGANLEMNLPGSATSFPVPDGFLKPDTPYKIGVAARGANGNRSLTEAEFRTLP
jgi:hypothetical protein